jgi:hypothetical protein
MKNLIIALLILFLFVVVSSKNSCKTGKDTENVSLNKPNYNFKTFQFDTTARNSVKKDRNSVGQWSNLDDFFPVYQFSDARLGIGIEIGDGGHYELTDSFFNKFTQESDPIVDTSGAFILKKSDALGTAIFNNDTTHFFNIYCTKGRTTSRIKAVLYNSGNCSQILVFELMPIDKAKFGEPLMASKQVFDLNYSPFAGFQEDLNIYEKYLGDHSDYQDSMHFVQFAHNNTLFFAFSDDFNWHKKQDNRCLFPSRHIFKKEGRMIKEVWAKALDIFGIPCD